MYQLLQQLSAKRRQGVTFALFDNASFEQIHPRDNQGRFKSSVDFAHHKGKADLKEIFDIAISRRDGNKSFANISSISKILSQKISEVLGIDVDGWVHGIDESAIRHILKRHGNMEQEAKLGQVAVSRLDIERIGEVLNNPDIVEYGGLNDRGNETLIIKKEIANHVVCIQEVRKGHKKLAITSLWIKKKATS